MENTPLRLALEELLELFKIAIDTSIPKEEIAFREYLYNCFVYSYDIDLSTHDGTELSGFQIGKNAEHRFHESRKKYPKPKLINTRTDEGKLLVKMFKNIFVVLFKSSLSNHDKIYFGTGMKDSFKDHIFTDRDLFSNVEFVEKFYGEISIYIDEQIGKILPLLANENTTQPAITKEPAKEVHSSPPVDTDNTIFALNPIWKHGIDKLSEISAELFEDGFTSENEGFKNIFNRNTESTCDWLKTRTAFLYLLNLLINKNDNMPDVVLDLVCKKVLFKGKTTTRHTLKTQLAKIRSIFSLKSNELEAQYSEIFHIHNHIF